MDNSAPIIGITGVTGSTLPDKALPVGKAKDSEDKKLRKACADFEAFFVYYMLKTMRETVPKSNFLGNSAGTDTYNMMMDQRIAESVANRGNGLGMKKMILDQMSKIK
jgi:flagellar protein FlgJ